MTTFQKIVKYAAMIFAFLLTASILSLAVNLITEVIDHIGGADENTVNETYTFDDVDILDIEMGFGDLNIRCEGSEFKVIAHELLGFSIKENNGKLKIETGSRNFFSGGSSENASLEIIVPKGYALKELIMELGAGECEVRDISASVTDFDTGAGELNCAGLTTEKCKIDAGVGEVNVSINGNVSDYNIKLDKGIGSASINGERYSESKHKLKGAPFSLDVDCGIGSINIDFEQ